MALRYSEEELASIQSGRRDALMEQLLQSSNALTEEELEKLRAGEMTTEEAVAIAMERGGALPEDASGESGEETTEEAGAQDAQTADQSDGGAGAEVTRLVSSFYSLQGSFESRIEGIRQAGISRFYALEPADRTRSALLSIASDCISQASGLEQECDSQMDALLSQLSRALEASGGDMSLVSEIKYYYASAKSVKKAQYMSEYKQYIS